jgi:hypothetical protein
VLCTSPAVVRTLRTLACAIASLGVACGGRVAEPGFGLDRTLAGDVFRPSDLVAANADSPGAASADASPVEATLSAYPCIPVDLLGGGGSTDSSPLPPPPVSAAAPMTCACEEVTISCDGAPRGYASVDRDTCEMSLSRASCAATGSVPGVRVETGALLDLESIAFSAETSPEELYARCAVAHEARHACDGPRVRSCETEQRAFETSAQCFRTFQRRHCEGSASSVSCAWAARYLEASELARDLTACLCEASSSCGSCTRACAAGRDADLAQYCGVAAAAYCQPAGK